MTLLIQATDLNDVAAALCATRANWGSLVTNADGDLFRGADEALSMVYGRAQDMDPEAFEAYRNLTALFYVLKTVARGYGRSGEATSYTAFHRFARRFA